MEDPITFPKGMQCKEPEVAIPGSLRKLGRVELGFGMIGEILSSAVLGKSAAQSTR